jgi:putative sigma-54 modulation protein
MKANINSVHFKADKKLLDFVSEKVEKLTNTYNGVIGSDVILKLENTDTPDNKVAEIRIFIKGNDLYAKKHSKTFEEATDTAVEALRRQLTKYKDKIRKH